MADNMIDREFGWDDTIEHDSEFVLLPEGDYWFTVLSFERGRYTPGKDGKLPPCNMAVLKLEVTNGVQTSTVFDRLYLHSKCEGFLCAFFSAIGQRKHGEPLKMNWNTVPGSRGRCKVSVETYNGNQSNRIKSYYDYDAAKMTVPSAAPQTSYQPGQF